MRPSVLFLALTLATSAFGGVSTTPPTTTNNDDSCDIAVMPAATLLLPYFEVDVTSPQSSATTTLFTVQNVSQFPQIAHVTLWTNWSFPALQFSIFLTGYDAQSINLWDILVRGQIAPGPGLPGTSFNTSVPTNPTIGSQPAANDANQNFLPSARTSCTNLPGNIPTSLVTDLQMLFTRGKSSGSWIVCGSGALPAVGGVQPNAVGYVTIDVSATCTTSNPATAGYFETVLFDNVLLGDYQQIVPRGAKSYAQGGPLVHIRAIPEGGPSGAIPGTNLPYTFYDRLTSLAASRTIDRRQPLPSAFAPRFIQGGPGAFNTSYKIWREAVTPPITGCSGYSANSDQQYTEIARFDEHENATLSNFLCVVLCPRPPGWPSTTSMPSNASQFPPISTSGDVAGWMLMNLNNGGSTAYSTARPWNVPNTWVRQSQNWVITSMFAEPTYAIEMMSPVLGNGCTPALPTSIGGHLGPPPNPTP